MVSYLHVGYYEVVNFLDTLHFLPNLLSFEDEIILHLNWEPIPVHFKRVCTSLRRLNLIVRKVNDSECQFCTTPQLQYLRLEFCSYALNPRLVLWGPLGPTLQVFVSHYTTIYCFEPFFFRYL